ncbi:MAG: hypothetical protein H0U27_07395 [Nitrosopumilus sp.]|nr:hypothetical protein [Nitrosopumilus sp.]
MKNVIKTIIPVKIPYNKPFDTLLIFNILVLYRKIPVTIPIDIEVIVWIAIPAAIDIENEE